MFKLPELSYKYDELEPYIDGQTMELHHSMHHQAYIDKLNAAIEETEWSGREIEHILQSLESLPENIRTVVRNNGGGHYNHSFFWECMSPHSTKMPRGDLASMLNSNFGSFSSFKEQFSTYSGLRFW